jgi:hypothetical protein
MVGKEEKEPIKPSELALRVVDAMNEAKDLDRKGAGNSATVGGVTVTWEGLSKDPEIRVADNVEVKK